MLSTLQLPRHPKHVSSIASKAKDTIKKARSAAFNNDKCIAGTAVKVPVRATDQRKTSKLFELQFIFTKLIIAA